MLKSDNPKVERSAVLIGNSSVFGLQLERMFREAGNPGRRVFRSVDTIVTWLDESLDEAERTSERTSRDAQGHVVGGIDVFPAATNVAFGGG